MAFSNTCIQTNKMNSILLSVAIPTYNGGKSLLDAVESCRYLQLADDEFEVLVVDNCSNDGSVNNLQKQRKNFKSLRIVENDKNYGRIGNWNRCLKLARGEFILFLFSNDLIAKDNHIEEAIAVLRHKDDCSLVNMPWIISDYKMTDISLPPQFFRRTPGYGYFDCAKYIKDVVESGKLPFVPLQSNLLRKSIIQKKGILFDPELPISSDGVFLSELAIQSEVVGFYDRPSIIWRHDAPGRLHGHIKMNEHIKQVIKSFSIIGALSNNGINITKAIANYEAPEYFIVSLIKARSKSDLVYSRQLLFDWWLSVKKYDIYLILFIIRLIWRFIKLPLKIKTFLLLLYNRVKKYPG